MLPEKRQEKLLVQEIGEELLLYDLERHQALVTLGLVGVAAYLLPGCDSVTAPPLNLTPDLVLLQSSPEPCDDKDRVWCKGEVVIVAPGDNAPNCQGLKKGDKVCIPCDEACQAEYNCSFRIGSGESGLCAVGVAVESGDRVCCPEGWKRLAPPKKNRRGKPVGPGWSCRAP